MALDGNGHLFGVQGAETTQNKTSAFEDFVRGE
jgi:hypothetical protein